VIGGVFPDLRKPGSESDFYFVEADGPEAAIPHIVDLVKTRIARRFGLDPIRDIQALCPMNRAGVGARSLNIELQAALNPPASAKWKDTAGSSRPATGHADRERSVSKESAGKRPCRVLSDNAWDRRARAERNSR